jgi:hypothetical protein
MMFHVKHWAQPQTPSPCEGGRGGVGRGGRKAQGRRVGSALPSLLGPNDCRGSPWVGLDKPLNLCYNVGAAQQGPGGVKRRT